MEAKDLKNFEKKIVRVEFSEYMFWSQFAVGVIVFCKNGIVVYTGKEENGFSGMQKVNNFEEEKLLKDYIPFANIVSVIEYADVKSLGNVRLNNISDMLQNKKIFNVLRHFVKNNIK